MQICTQLIIWHAPVTCPRIVFQLQCIMQIYHHSFDKYKVAKIWNHSCVYLFPPAREDHLLFMHHDLSASAELKAKILVRIHTKNFNQTCILFMWYCEHTQAHSHKSILPEIGQRRRTHSHTHIFTHYRLLLDRTNACRQARTQLKVV